MKRPLISDPNKKGSPIQHVAVLWFIYRNMPSKDIFEQVVVTPLPLCFGTEKDIQYMNYDQITSYRIYVYRKILNPNIRVNYLRQKDKMPFLEKDNIPFNESLIPVININRKRSRTRKLSKLINKRKRK